MNDMIRTTLLRDGKLGIIINQICNPFGMKGNTCKSYYPPTWQASPIAFSLSNDHWFLIVRGIPFSKGVMFIPKHDIPGNVWVVLKVLRYFQRSEWVHFPSYSRKTIASGCWGAFHIIKLLSTLVIILYCSSMCQFFLFVVVTSQFSTGFPSTNAWMRPCPDERGSESSPSSLHARESTIGLGFGRGENHLFMPFPARCNRTTDDSIHSPPTTVTRWTITCFSFISFCWRISQAKFYQWSHYLSSSKKLYQVMKYSIGTICLMSNEIYLPEYVAREILSSGKYSLTQLGVVFDIKEWKKQ